MSDDRWQRVSAIYQEALELDPGARELYLRGRCEGDESLIAELRSLLHKDSRTERLLERNASHVDLVGQRLGAYAVQSLIGSGGMGEVYRAHDTKLGRDVAIKILPTAFVADRERLLRFEREARVLATLNHPHIGGIYGVEESDGVRALVLEMVQGETLADQLARGPMTITDALRVARQIADALEAAHEKGIVHRDLKPANIKITPDGYVKVLDFGLAKVAQASGAELQATRDGVILGTAGYMSPEQARGKAVDKRSDIWAFGCVLYEMLTGQLAFGGETLSDTIGGILEREPEWRLLPEESPAPIRKLLKRCLEKDPKRRLHDIADARLDIADALTAGPAHDVASDPLLPRRARLPMALASLCGIVLAGTWALLYFRGAPADPLAVRFVIAPPDGVSWALPNATDNEAPNTVLAISPDGRRVVYTGRTGNGTTSLFIRSLETLDSQPLIGTDGATSPFWSPDSRSVGFFADGKLKRIDAAGGAAKTLCEVTGNRGATWGADGVIVFATFPGLQKVSAAGGIPTSASAVAEGERYHARPHFLPGSRHFIYRAQGPEVPPEPALRRSGGEALRGNRYYLGSLDSTERTPLFTVDSGNVVYSAGYLLFIQNESTLMAQPFDAERLRLTGAPIPVADKIRMSTGHRPLFGLFSASQTGALVYLTRGGGPGSGLSWFDRTGRQLDTLPDSEDAADPVLSADGMHVSYTRRDPTVNTGDIWLTDVARKTPIRLTVDPQEDRDVVWAPDGRRVVFASNRRAALTVPLAMGEGYDLFQRTLSGPLRDEVLLEGGRSKFPTSWSPDGRFILYEDGVGSSYLIGNDLWVLPVADRKPFPFIQSPQFSESQGQFSLDGRWVAYVSNQSGTFEVYVASFPGAETRFRVSTNGGTRPRWRRDGSEIFFRSPDNKLMAASVSVAGHSFTVGEVKVLFDNEIIRAGSPSYAVSPDGQRFLVNTAATAPMTVVLNWQAGLRK